jgi:hypoxanthine phosphoribosyltransferase
MNKIFLSYNDVYSHIRSYEKHLVELKPDVVVGVMRDGIIPAIMISEMLDIPFTSIRWRDGLKFENQDLILQHKRILFVDDICATGGTLRTIKYLFEKKYLGAYTFLSYTLYTNKKSIFYPDISTLAPDDYIVFPWDVYEWSNENIRKLYPDAYSLQGKIKPICATDLDGVLCKDLNFKNLFVRFLERFFPSIGTKYINFLRNNLKCIRSKRAFPWQISFIVTGRLQTPDYIPTKTWLTNNGWGNQKVFMLSGDKKSRTIEDIINLKEQIIKQQNINIFIESSPRQAFALQKKLGNRCSIYLGEDFKED